MSGQQYEEVWCHCPAGPGGHPPGTGECTERLRAVRVPRWAGTVSVPKDEARGTCPVCSRSGVQVKCVERTVQMWEGLRRVRVGLRPALVPHRTAPRTGDPCSGAGEVPAELTFRPSLDERGWVREHGSESVQ